MKVSRHNKYYIPRTYFEGEVTGLLGGVRRKCLSALRSCHRGALVRGRRGFSDRGAEWTSGYWAPGPKVYFAAHCFIDYSRLVTCTTNIKRSLLTLSQVCLSIVAMWFICATPGSTGQFEAWFRFWTCSIMVSCAYSRDSWSELTSGRVFGSHC